MKLILLVLTLVISTLNAIDTDENALVVKRRKVTSIKAPHVVTTLRNRECAQLCAADQELLFRLRHPDKPAIDDLFYRMDNESASAHYFELSCGVQLKKLAPSILRLPTDFLRDYLKVREGEPKNRPGGKWTGKSIIFDNEDCTHKVCNILIDRLLEDDTIPELLPKLLCCLGPLHRRYGSVITIERINQNINAEGKYPELTTIEKDWKRDWERLEFQARYSHYARVLQERIYDMHSRRIRFRKKPDTTLERRHSTSW